ncbi:MAG TPA: RNA methyltransferase [Fimbriiglobus sp.]
MIANCRVVLVRTEFAGNIGATARAMANFGLSDLVLVAPVANPAAHQARLMATNGTPILDAARIVPDFDSAVADCGMVLGTSAKTVGAFRETACGTPDELLPHFVSALREGPAALVFGPEPHGLTTAELARCHALLTIPTHPSYPALNLGLCVGICLYELRQHAERGRETPLKRTAAPFADFDRSLEHLREAFAAVGFLHGQKAESLMMAFRHLLAKAAPTPQEVKMIHGLARQLLYQAKLVERLQLTPEDVIRIDGLAAEVGDE